MQQVRHYVSELENLDATNEEPQQPGKHQRDRQNFIDYDYEREAVLSLGRPARPGGARRKEKTKPRRNIITRR